MAVTAANARFAEDSLLPISALQHLIFCERQCALIHIERQWADNVLTVEGSLQHRRVDRDGPRLEQLGELRVARALALRSLRWGLTGYADVVELHPDPAGAEVSGLAGRWRPLPIEHKRGRPKAGDADRVQLCAQALCIEEMLDTKISLGALYYGKRRRRTEVVFDQRLRDTTSEASKRLHEMFTSGRTPRAERQPKCERCSLQELCMPDALEPTRSAKQYLETLYV